MKVAEVVEKLLKLPQDADCYFLYYDEGGDSWDKVNVITYLEEENIVLMKESARL
jgi:hypothetical protein